MPPKRSNAETTELATIITQQLAAILPTLMTQLNDSRRQEGNSNGSNDPNPIDHSYKAFTNAKPTTFYGTEGATGLLQWLEQMEATLDLSACPENFKVKYASSTFQKRALTWWNNELRTRGRETALAMSWAEFKEVLTQEYISKHELQKLEAEFWNHTMEGTDHLTYTTRFHELSMLVPHMVTPESRGIDLYISGLPDCIRSTIMAVDPPTLQSAIHLAARLTDDQAKMTATIKRQKTIENHELPVIHAIPIQSVAPTPPRSSYTGNLPLCTKCNRHHYSNHPCRQCTKCGKVGHSANYCRTPAPANIPVTTTGRVCYECGSADHLRNRCPTLTNDQGARGRVFAITAAETLDEPTDVTGKYFGNNHYTRTSFSTGPDTSLVSIRCTSMRSMNFSIPELSYTADLANYSRILTIGAITKCQRCGGLAAGTPYIYTPLI